MTDSIHFVLQAIGSLEEKCHSQNEQLKVLYDQRQSYENQARRAELQVSSQSVNQPLNRSTTPITAFVYLLLLIWLRIRVNNSKWIENKGPAMVKWLEYLICAQAVSRSESWVQIPKKVNHCGRKGIRP